MLDRRRIAELLPYLTRREVEEMDALLSARTPWAPNRGPQTMAYNSVADVLGYGGAAGGGKMLDARTPIPTPHGWIAIGDLRIGDLVFDDQGLPCRVTAVSPIVTPRTCYRVRFDDGAELDACSEHLWETFDVSELAALTRLDDSWRARRRASRCSRRSGNKSEAFSQSVSDRNQNRQYVLKAPPSGTVRDTETIAQTLLTKNGRRNHAIANTAAIDLPDAALPIDPYTLGAWLGDGTSANGGFTGVDPQILKEIEGAGIEVRHSQRDPQHHHLVGIIGRLRDLRVLNNKHIPPIYLRSSVAQRLALLQGLMDTDGHATQSGGACEFDGTNFQLIQGVHEIVLSLGIKATISEGVAKLKGRVIGPKWRIKFVSSLPVFRLHRKLQRQNRKPRRTTQFRYITACERIRSVPMRCIAVDSASHLYLAGLRFIPTHNTDLLLGLAHTKHQRSVIYRREYTQLEGMIDRSHEMFDGVGRFRASPHPRWILDDKRLVQFLAAEKETDVKKHQGKPNDFIGFDELPHFSEFMFRFLIAWNRTTRKDQRCRVVAAFNPPTDAEGDWVINYWGPWLDRRHPRPAKPGELRWYATIAGEDVERPNGKPFWHDDELIQPRSRTFYPARIEDNPFLMATGYKSTLQSLPEPLRSLMLKGSFDVRQEDHAWQVIPSAWLQAAMDRWTEKTQEELGPMSALGVDVARGGKDKSVYTARYSNYFAKQIAKPGRSTPDGQAVIRDILPLISLRPNVPVNVDAIGIGSSPVDIARMFKIRVNALVGSNGSMKTDKSKKFRFFNKRAEYIWLLREALDPASKQDLAIPPDRELFADLTAIRWELTARGIKIEDKDDIKERIKRSPDKGESLIYAHADVASVVTAGPIVVSGGPREFPGQ